MEDYEVFCKKQLSRIRGELTEGESSLPVQHRNISFIQFNGIPVLSPLLTLEKRKELQQDRQKALELEIWRQNSRKRILLNRVQEIVENVQMKKLSSQTVDDSEAVNIHLDLEPQVPNGLEPQSKTPPVSAGSTEPERASQVKLGEAQTVNNSFLEGSGHFIPCKPEETCCVLSEKRVCPEGSSSSSIHISPSSEAVKKEEIGPDAEVPDPYKISLQNLLKKSREYVQREQSRRSLRSNSKRSNSESHSDKENDAVKLSDLVKERGKVTGRSCASATSDKPNPVKSSTSLQNAVTHPNSVVASSSFSKVDIPMRSGTPPVLDSDSDEEFKNTSFFERGSILRSLMGSYAKLPSPEPSMSPKMHRRRPRPSSVGHIVISNPINAYELSPKEKGKAVDSRKQDGADRQAVSDPVPKLTSNFASFGPSKVHISHRRSPNICDEVAVGKQGQMRQHPADEQKNKRFPVGATEDEGLVVDAGEASTSPPLNPNVQDPHAIGCPVTMQNPVIVSGTKQILEKAIPMELNKSYDVERPSPLLMQMQRKQQMDTPSIISANEQILESRVEKVKRRLEMETENIQTENTPCVITAEVDPRETQWPLDPRCPLGTAFGAKSEMLQRNSSEEEALKQKMLAFEELRKRLEEQHAQQLSFLIAEQEREQERLRKELVEQEWRPKGGETAVSEMNIPPIAIHSEMDLEWNMAGDPNLLKSVLSRVETAHGTASENTGLTAESPFYLWEPPASGKSVPMSRTISASRSISRSKMRWSQVYSPEMKRKLNKISALAKGFLTRRLLQTEKLKHLRQTVKDTMEFIKNFQAEAPLKRGSVSAQDANLQERVAAQLRAALYDIHDIFFKIDVSERMAILRHDRDVRKEKMLRQLDKAKIPRERVTLSTATQKSLDRKKYLKASEIGMANKKTLAKQKNPENRVLQPNQGQNAPVQRFLSRQGTPKTSVKGAEQNRKKPPGSRMPNKGLSGVYAGRIQRKRPNVVTT